MFHRKNKSVLDQHSFFANKIKLRVKGCQEENIVTVAS